MHIGIETLEKLAHLSRLDLDPASKDQLLTDLNRMLSFVEDRKSTRLNSSHT